MQDMKYLLAIGNPIRGLSFIGPFGSRAEAKEWAFDKPYSWLAPIQPCDGSDDGKFVVSFGGVDGYEFYGPFRDSDAALKFAEDDRYSSWDICKMKKP